MSTCRRCATENPGGLRFCGACGAPLVGGDSAAQARKVVTALFCDVAGSTALGEEFDPETVRNVLSRYFEDISATIERHGGTVQKYAGDAVMAVFGVPSAHEDDALRAVRAAVEIRERLPSVADKVGVPLRFRTGLNTGLVLADEGTFVAIGDAVNVAARLEQAAQPGEILLGHETLALVRDAVEVEPLEPLTIRGKTQPVHAFRLLGVDPTAPGRVRRIDTRLIGRDPELRLLRETWESVVGEAGCHMLTVLGTAGVGKSRLVAELLDQVGDATTILRGRCLDYGEGITFWPIIQALTSVGDRARSIVERLDSGGAATREELFWEVRRLLESLARDRPVILHVDDLQWAESMLLDLLDHIVDLSRDAPILVLCTARPELVEERPAWGRGKLNATTLLLEPLALAECEELIDQLDDALEPHVRARVITASDGNPLFLHELVELARELGTVVIPQTIQALLTARLEALIAQERELLEHGSVEGHVFHRSAVRALSAEPAVERLEADLAGLVGKHLILPHPASVPGDEAFRFRHLLIRDAAYERLPKATRADLHERFAQWLVETLYNVPELDEIAGWHLEQAVLYRRELSLPVDSALCGDAARRLHSGGRRAGERSDVAAARNLLERAHSLAPGDAAIATDFAERLIEAGELQRADEMLAVAEAHGQELGPAVLCRLEWRLEARPADATQLIESKVPGILAALEQAGDERGLARAHWLVFIAQWNACQATAAAEQARLTATHARAAGDMGLASRALGWYVATLIYGPADTRTISAESRRDRAPAVRPVPGRLSRSRTRRGRASRRAVRRGTRPRSACPSRVRVTRDAQHDRAVRSGGCRDRAVGGQRDCRCRRATTIGPDSGTVWRARRHAPPRSRCSLRVTSALERSNRRAPHSPRLKSLAAPRTRPTSSPPTRCGVGSRCVWETTTAPGSRHCGPWRSRRRPSSLRSGRKRDLRSPGSCARAVSASEPWSMHERPSICSGSRAMSPDPPRREPCSELVHRDEELQVDLADIQLHFLRWLRWQYQVDALLGVLHHHDLDLIGHDQPLAAQSWLRVSNQSLPVVVVVERLRGDLVEDLKALDVPRVSAHDLTPCCCRV